MSVALQTAPTPQTDPSDIEGLADRLRESFRSGRTRPLEWRREQLEQLKKMMKENSDELVAALQADLGKPMLEAVTTDLVAVVQECDLALKNLKKWTAPEKVSTPLSQQPARARIVRDPLGVVLIISPWNYPVQLLLSPLSGAIAAGNCAVLKPSELTPNVSSALAKLVPRYLDPSCISLVEGAVPETTALLEQRFDHIFYTGNGRVARVVMAAAAKHLTPVTLELGGKSPCIIDSSVDLEVACRRIAWGKWLNAGQTCIAPDYLLVERGMEQAVSDQLAKTVEEFYGKNPQETDDFGRIVSLPHHRRLASMLKDGEVIFGGEVDESERYIAPTLLKNVPDDSAPMTEEIFGPILPMRSVDSLDEAIEFVNRGDKPLALYLFSSRSDAEERVLAETSSGGVCVNGTIWHIANPNVPFGGVGESGMGTYHGKASFEAFSHRKGVVTKSTRMDLKIMYPPYGGMKSKLVKKML